ncbi:hypothetical protein LX32DRAFT_696042 [Colletotrichum zoysiae]|uniref:Uncharacterized protein n=1 Tax=Colletotrichum zoysiae TaxID=1216348 RepID=A0AAD9LXD8_9PEZI|nr:hypothetical protein LX32DRAFT_696042 [Colletotrichum zoysiae]
MGEPSADDEDGLYGPAARQLDAQLASLKLLVDNVLVTLLNLVSVLVLGPALEKDIFGGGGVLGEAVYELRHFNVTGRTVCTDVKQSVNISR